MNLVNKQVTHNIFGKGSVVEYNDSYIKVHFAFGNKNFVFPDAFGTYLTLIDKRAANLVRRMIQKKEKESKEEELRYKKLKALQRQRQQRLLEQKKIVKKHKTTHPSSQVVFWCKAQDQDRVFSEWSIFTGTIKSGDKKGQPRTLVRLNQNTACLLTARDHDMPEKDRYILGAYMVNEAFRGKQCKDGYIPAHSEYRFRLSKQESEQMLFWNYYVNKRYPHKMTWNTGRHRYFDNIWMAQILRDIISLKKKPQECEAIQRFFEYFCRINGIKEEELSNPHGALMRI